MLARLAENLFWGGRYLERAEDTARLVDVTHHLLLEAAPEQVAATWEAVLEQLHVLHAYREWYGSWTIDPDAVLRFLVIEPDNPSSVVSAVTAARENARSVRELISIEVWEASNDVYLRLGGRDLAAELVDRPFGVFRDVKQGCQTVLGAVSETMPRDDTYRFLTLGRMLERAEMTSRLIEVRHDHLLSATTSRHRIALLRSIGALESFRRVFAASADPHDVLTLLLLDDSHPRSVLFALDRAHEQIERVGSGMGRAARELGRVRSGLRYRDVDEILEEGLLPFLDAIQTGVRATSDAVAAEFFRHAPPGALHAVATA